MEKQFTFNFLLDNYNGFELQHEALLRDLEISYIFGGVEVILRLEKVD